VYVSSGQVLKEDQQIALIRNPPLQERLHKLHSELYGLRDYREDSAHHDMLARFEERLALAREQADYFAERRDLVYFLRRQGAATLADLNLAESRYTDAQYALSLAKSALEEWRFTSIVQPELERKERESILQREIQTVEQELTLASISAESDCRVKELLIEKGSKLEKGDMLLIAVKKDGARVDVYMKPKLSAKLRIGQSVDIRLPSGKRIPATVAETAVAAVRLPPALATPITARQRRLVVHIKPEQLMVEHALVDGLPVQVYLHTFVYTTLRPYLDFFRRTFRGNA
jgi:multidrug resistance efflux pump